MLTANRDAAAATPDPEVAPGRAVVSGVETVPDAAVESSTPAAPAAPGAAGAPGPVASVLPTAALSAGVFTPGWYPQRIDLWKRGFFAADLGALGIQAARDKATARDAARFTEAIAAERWNPVEIVGDALRAALATRNVEVTRFDIVRQTAGGRSALRRDEIPIDGGVDFYLDADIQSVFLATRPVGSGWRPGIVVGYLWITAEGRPVDVRRTAVYNADIEFQGSTAGTFAPFAPRFVADVEPPEDCVFATPEDAHADMPRLRRCFQFGIDRLAAQIARTMPGLR